MKARSSLSIIVSISLVMIMLGGVGMVLLSGQRLANYVREHIILSVVLDNDMKEVKIRQLERILKVSKYVKSTEYITKELAENKLEKELGVKFSKVLDYNPLKASIDLKLKGDYAQQDSIAKIEKEILTYDGVQKVYYKKNFLTSVNENIRKITLILLVVSALLFLISFTLINNTIRLAIYAQRFLIKTMQIVGASDRFVRRPFVQEGILRGLIAGLLTALVLVGLVFLLPKDFQVLISIKDTYFLILLVIIIVLSVIFAWFATYFAVSRYLKKHETQLYK